MSRLLHRMWPAVFVVLLAVSGCGAPTPATDANDPLPKVFNNEAVDLSKYGPGSGRGGHGGRGTGGGGGIGAGGARSRHGKGNQDGTGGGARDGTGGGGMRAKQKAADSATNADNPPKEPGAKEEPNRPASDETKKSDLSSEPKEPKTDNKKVTNEPTRKEQP